MEYVLSLVWNYIETAYILTLGRAFLQERLTKKQSLTVYLASSFLLFLMLTALSGHTLRQFIVYAYYFALSCLLFRGSVLVHLLVSVIGYIFAGIFDSAILYGSCALMGISLSEFIWKKLAYCAAVTISKLLALFLAWLLFTLRKQKSEQPIRSRWLLLTLIFPCVSLMMLTVIFPSYQSSSDLSIGAFVFSIGLAAANIAILYLIQHMQAQAQNEHEMTLLNQQMEIQTDSIAALERSYRAQRQATHEFNHHLQIISDLLANGDPGSAKEYLAKLLQTQTTRILCVNSGHPIVDAVVNQKYQAAKAQDTDMQIQVNDLSGIAMETDVLVVLLSNLLDNALEACQKVAGERTIVCSILAGEQIFLSIRNTSNPVNIIGGTIPTSKYPKEDHGYGLLNTQRILERIGAEYTFSYDDGWFCFAAEIPN